MGKPIVCEIDCETGIQTTREMTDGEYSAYLVSAEESEKQLQAQREREKAQEAAKQSATEKLTKLGLSPDEIAALVK